VLPCYPVPGDYNGEGRGDVLWWGCCATYLDNAVDADTSLLQDCNNVLAALCRLVGDAAGDQLTLVVGGDLSGDEDLGAGDNGLALRCSVSTRA
jgi:hypothetical protein